MHGKPYTRTRSSRLLPTSASANHFHQYRPAVEPVRCYRNAGAANAQIAAQSQSVDTNITMSKSPLVSGAMGSGSEQLDEDGGCWVLGCSKDSPISLSTGLLL